VNPVIKVPDLAWLTFEKPDLDRAATFGEAFGLALHARTPDALYFRGTWANPPCLVIRRGPVARFVGPTFHAADAADLERLALAHGVTSTALEAPLGGRAVTLADPSGVRVQVVHGATVLPALPDQAPQAFNFATARPRTNAGQRPPREPARVQRLGHVVLMTASFLRDLDWYLNNLGLIVSDFLFMEAQPERGPAMAFIRCDRGTVPADHHTLAMTIGPDPGYVHSAYQVTDLDALAAGGEHLGQRGYRRAWGIGRHILGSQLFDYWRDPDEVMMEHFTDGDVFDSSAPTGWEPMSAANLAQWGPKVTTDFMGTTPSPRLVMAALKTLRGENELDVSRLLGLMKAMKP
jgi:catechol 2,3-dioxygenase-like lactoylglutathione lyase family enzyme